MRARVCVCVCVCGCVGGWVGGCVICLYTWLICIYVRFVYFSTWPNPPLPDPSNFSSPSPPTSHVHPSPSSSPSSPPSPTSPPITSDYISIIPPPPICPVHPYRSSSPLPDPFILFPPSPPSHRPLCPPPPPLYGKISMFNMPGFVKWPPSVTHYRKLEPISQMYTESEDSVHSHVPSMHFVIDEEEEGEDDG